MNLRHLQILELFIERYQPRPHYDETHLHPVKLELLTLNNISWMSEKHRHQFLQGSNASRLFNDRGVAEWSKQLHSRECDSFVTATMSVMKDVMQNFADSPTIDEDVNFIINEVINTAYQNTKNLDDNATYMEKIYLKFQDSIKFRSTTKHYCMIECPICGQPNKTLCEAHLQGHATSYLCGNINCNVDISSEQMHNARKLRLLNPTLESICVGTPITDVVLDKNLGNLPFEFYTYLFYELYHMHDPTVLSGYDKSCRDLIVEQMRPRWHEIKIKRHIDINKVDLASLSSLIMFSAFTFNKLGKSTNRDTIHRLNFEIECIYEWLRVNKPQVQLERASGATVSLVEDINSYGYDFPTNSQSDTCEKQKPIRFVSAEKSHRNNIYLLSTKSSSHAVADFEHCINEENTSLSLVNLKLGSDSTKDEGIRTALQSVEFKSGDILAIVRGGGDTNNKTFTCFHSKDALGYIKELQCAGVTIVTGIGHAKDSFPIEDIAHIKGITPTDAAYKLNNHIQVKYKKRK